MSWTVDTDQVRECLGLNVTPDYRIILKMADELDDLRNMKRTVKIHLDSARIRNAEFDLDPGFRKAFREAGGEP